MNAKEYTVVDLFSGAGGMSEGFREAGFEILLGIDNVESFVETFKKNHGEAASICGDVREISVRKIKKTVNNGKVDVVIGGPPCQGFSIAGRRDPKDPRSSLFMEFVRIVKGLKPPCFVMENVPGILSMKTTSGVKVSDIIEEEFKNIGYEVEKRKLISADYGVPQKRKRVFFIGTNSGRRIKWPEKTHAKESYVKLTGEVIPTWVGVGSVLLDEKDVPETYFHSDRMIEGFIRRRERHKLKGNGFGWQILHPDKPSYTLSARYWKDGSDALVKYSDTRIRMLTPRECARIQSFPDDYCFSGSKRLKYTQIGNAVPPLMAKAIAIEIRELLNEI